MRGCIAALPLLFCMLSATASAQDGLQSASLPERQRVSNRTPPPDLFRVEPGFYETRRHRQPLDVTPQYPVLLDPYGWAPGYGIGASPPVSHSAPPLPTTAPPRPASVFPVIDLPPVQPGVPKTFYVITGCYAGDKPPDPSSLRAGCDLATLRVVPPLP